MSRLFLNWVLLGSLVCFSNEPDFSRADLTSNDDVSKYLQYSQNVLTPSRAWMNFIYAFSGSILGSIALFSMNRWSPTKADDFSKWGISVKAMAAFTAKNGWDTWEAGKEIIFAYLFFGSDPIVTKSDPVTLGRLPNSEL